MTRPPLKDVGASVRKRLTDTARQRDENAQLLMLRFAIERLIFRLSQSVYRDQFILKGAMLFSLWAPVPYRSTGDLDLLGQGDPTPARIAAIFKTLCGLTVQDDGVVYDGESVRAESTREDEDYRGVRVTLTATLAKARLALQIDIGFGDAVTPAAIEVVYPSLLDFQPARMKAYPPETVIAEKLEAMVTRGIGNSRMKDFFDIWVLAKTFSFEGGALAAAVAATFDRRQTALPEDTPVALTDAFAADANKQAQWRGFLQRTQLAMAPDPLPELTAFIASFLLPLLRTDAVAVMKNRHWPAGGPWGDSA
jgi:hypothetical protein